MTTNTSAHMLFGKNKVFIVNFFSDLNPNGGQEDNLYVVRFTDDGKEETKAYEWRNNAYHPFTFGSGNLNPSDEDAGVVIVDTRYDLPKPVDVKFSTLYIVLTDITAENKTTMYIRLNDSYLLLAAFSAGGAVQEYTQITKLGVIASTASPRVYEIPIPRTTNFLRAPIEVLKFTPGAQGMSRIEIDFNNGDATDFEPNEYVIFDGTMRLRDEWELPLVKDTTWAHEGAVQYVDMDTSRFVAVGGIKFE